MTPLALILVVIVSGLIYFAMGMGVATPPVSASQASQVFDVQLRAQLASPTICPLSLDLANDPSRTFNFAEASTDAGQAIRISIGTLESGEILPNLVVGEGSELVGLKAELKSLRLAKARAILGAAAPGFTQYSAVVESSYKPRGLGGLDSKPQVVGTIVFNVQDADQRVVACQIQENAAIMCSRMGGIFNALGTPPCVFAGAGFACPEGQLLTGISAGGDPTCVPYDVSCPAGQYASGINASGIVCSALPPVAGIGGGDPTPSTTTTMPPPAPGDSPGVYQVGGSGTLSCPADPRVTLSAMLAGTFSYPATPDEASLVGTSCYAIGYQCREAVYSRTIAGFPSESCSTSLLCMGMGWTENFRRSLECVPGTPTLGPIKSIPVMGKLVTGSIVGTVYASNIGSRCFYGNACIVGQTSSCSNGRETLVCGAGTPPATLGTMVKYSSGVTPDQYLNDFGVMTDVPCMGMSAYEFGFIAIEEGSPCYVGKSPTCAMFLGGVLRCE